MWRKLRAAGRTAKRILRGIYDKPLFQLYLGKNEFWQNGMWDSSSGFILFVLFCLSVSSFMALGANFLTKSPLLMQPINQLFVLILNLSLTIRVLANIEYEDGDTFKDFPCWRRTMGLPFPMPFIGLAMLIGLFALVFLSLCRTVAVRVRQQYVEEQDIIELEDKLEGVPEGRTPETAMLVASTTRLPDDQLLRPADEPWVWRPPVQTDEVINLTR